MAKALEERSPLWTRSSPSTHPSRSLGVPASGASMSVPVNEKRRNTTADGVLHPFELDLRFFGALALSRLNGRGSAPSSAGAHGWSPLSGRGPLAGLRG